MLNWRLWGSLPRPKPYECFPTAGHAFVAHDRALARVETGPDWLRNPAVAALVADTIRYGETGRRFYELHAWMVMPNHVHILIEPQVTVAILMRWVKGASARASNRLLGRTGLPFWQDESFDHYVRSTEEFVRIENNPVSAGLVNSAELWPWSSASLAGRRACPT